MKTIRTLLLTAIIAALSTLAPCPGLQAADTAPPPAKSDAKHPPQLVEPAEAQKLIKDKKVLVLDVRTPSEYAAGHLAGATNIDFRGQDFQARVAKLDKSQPYLVHCAVGARSARACAAMDQLDFKALYDLKGGISAWQKAGLPVEK